MISLALSPAWYEGLPVSNDLKRLCVCIVVVSCATLTACSRQPKTVAAAWNPKTAAAYLDAREVTWMGWPVSARDHDTFCVSCHTVVPYAISRPALRPALAEQSESPEEGKILNNITKRVLLWNETGPYYADPDYGPAKTSESRGTEAVLNALILASHDARSGKLSEITRSAFANMWASQLTEGDAKGSWPWLRFGMDPWEGNDSQYYGAALAAVAIGIAPEDYHSGAEIHDNVKLLRDYLNENYRSQSVMNRVALLWAASKLPGFISRERQRAINQEITDAQHSDGGWGLSSLAWPSGWNLSLLERRCLRSDWTRQDSASDGYATGFMTFVLQETGESSEDLTVKRGLAWLASNQSPTDGSWPSVSLNQRRNPSSNTGHFMRDAATAYAVLALTENNRASSPELKAEISGGKLSIADGSRLDAETSRK
jgi:squalene-hopene/tetraprenyl-beta-curcumene cyclase